MTRYTNNTENWRRPNQGWNPGCNMSVSKI